MVNKFIVLNSHCQDFILFSCKIGCRQLWQRKVNTKNKVIPILFGGSDANAVNLRLSYDK